MIPPLGGWHVACFPNHAYSPAAAVGKGHGMSEIDDERDERIREFLVECNEGTRRARSGSRRSRRRSGEGRDSLRDRREVPHQQRHGRLPRLPGARIRRPRRRESLLRAARRRVEDEHGPLRGPAQERRSAPRKSRGNRIRAHRERRRLLRAVPAAEAAAADRSGRRYLVRLFRGARAQRGPRGRNGGESRSKRRPSEPAATTRRRSARSSSGS